MGGVDTKTHNSVRLTSTGLSRWGRYCRGSLLQREILWDVDAAVTLIFCIIILVSTRLLAVASLIAIWLVNVVPLLLVSLHNGITQ